VALREILTYPDPRLREVARPVAVVDDEIRALIEDMAETMYDAPGVGLAANQIGVPLRIFVIDIASDEEPSDLMVFINPKIEERDGTQVYKERCLSFPGVAEDVKRAATLKVTALNALGEPFELHADGLLAVAIQHENDHLDGVLMVDKFNALKRRMIGRKVSEAVAEMAE
jgi:peptide deformylase